MTRPVRTIGSEGGHKEDGASVLPLKRRGEKGGGWGSPPVAPSLPTRYPARGDVVLLGAPTCAHSRMRDLVTSCFVRGYVASHKTHVLDLSTGDRAPRRLWGPNVLRVSRSTRGSAILVSHPSDPGYCVNDSFY